MGVAPRRLAGALDLDAALEAEDLTLAGELVLACPEHVLETGASRFGEPFRLCPLLVAEGLPG